MDIYLFYDKWYIDNNNCGIDDTYGNNNIRNIYHMLFSLLLLSLLLLLWLV